MTARSDMDESMLDQAIAWRDALAHDDADWDGYIAWLESDARHRAAFDAITLVERMVEDRRDDVARLMDAREAAIPARRRMPRLFAYAGGGIAAAIAMIVAIPMLRAPEPQQSYSAGASASRAIALADGIRVTLAPASRIVVTGKGASGIELARGEAYFDVRHDPSRILNISAGRYNVTDIGTRFSVAIGGPVFRVGVSEGALAVSSSDSGESVQVRAGHQIIGDDRQMTLSPVESKDIGSWRSGRLSYSDAPLSLVAADISRYAGKMVVVDPALETLHFSGTLVIGDGSKLLSDLSTVMGVAVRAEGRGVRIAPAPR